MHDVSSEEVLVRIKDIFTIGEVGLCSCAVVVDEICCDVERWKIQYLFVVVNSSWSRLFGYARQVKTSGFLIEVRVRKMKDWTGEKFIFPIKTELFSPGKISAIKIAVHVCVVWNKLSVFSPFAQILPVLQKSKCLVKAMETNVMPCFQLAEECDPQTCQQKQVSGIEQGKKNQ